MSPLCPDEPMSQPTLRLVSSGPSSNLNGRSRAARPLVVTPDQGRPRSVSGGNYPPISLLSTGPNSSHRSPLNLLSFICWIGAKSFGLVLIVMPGSRLVLLNSSLLLSPSPSPPSGCFRPV